MMLDAILESTPWLYDLSITGLGMSICAGLTAAILAVVVLVINLVARRWLTAGQMQFLWGLVLLRMLIPMAPESSLSVQNVYFQFENWIAAPRTTERFPATAQGARSPLATTSTEVGTPAPPLMADRVSSVEGQLVDWLPLIWLGMALIVLSRTLVRHVVFCRRIARVGPCQDARLIDLCEKAVSEARVRCVPRLILFDGVAQPAVTGVFRPRLLLPSTVTELDDQPLRMILLHELMHLKRRDTVKAWGLLLVRVVQWWNPIFWLASLRYLNLREQACDAAVLKLMTANRSEPGVVARAYTDLLLSLSSRTDEGRWRIMLPASLLGFHSGGLQKRALANRLRSIQRGVVCQRRLQLGLIVLMIATVAMAGFTDARTPSARNPNAPSWPGSLQFDFTGGVSPEYHVSEGEWSQNQYDITKAVRRVASLEGLKSEEAADQCFLIIHQFAFYTVERLEAVSPSRHLTKPEASPNVALQTERAYSSESSRIATLTMSKNGENWNLDVFAPQSSHDMILRSIPAWEQSGLKQITIEAQIITSDHDLIESTGLMWDSLLRVATTSPSITSPNAEFDRTERERVSVSATTTIQEQVPVLVSELTAQQSQRLNVAARALKRGSFMFAPKITFFNGQRGEISSAVHRPYVTSYQVDENGVLQPRVDEYEDGLQIIVEAVCQADGQAVELSSGITLSEISDVHPVTTRLRHQRVTVHLPRMKKCCINVAATIPDGGTLLIGLPPAYERTQYSYVMLTPRVITD